MIVTTLFLSLMASAGEPTVTKCASCSIGSESTFDRTYSSDIDITNCSSIISASGVAGGTAVNVVNDYLSKSPSCFPDDPAVTSLYFGIVGEANDFEVMTNRQLVVSGSAGSASFSYNANLNPSGGESCSISMTIMSGSQIDAAAIYTPPPAFESLGNSYYSERGTAGVSSDLEIEASEPLEFIASVDIDVDNEWIPYDGCTEPILPASGQTPVATGLSGLYYRLVNGTTTVAAGVIAAQVEDEHIELGIFQDQGFVSSFGANKHTVVGQATVSFTASENEVAITEVWEDYTVASGDVNGDGDITHCDEVLINTLVGSVLGDSTYNPRGDFDIDGDIDSNDIAIAQSIYDAFGGLCPADLTKTGSVSFQDLNLFLQAFSNGGSEADMNCDGVIDFSDINIFTDLFENGC